MADLQPTHSCGLTIYQGVCYDGSAEGGLVHIARNYTRTDGEGLMRKGNPKKPYIYMPPMIGFVDVRGPGTTTTMEKMIEMILDNEMGTVWSSAWIYNHGNEVRTVTWCVDAFKFFDWAVEHDPTIKKRAERKWEWEV